jgi:hypothetical protein
MRAGAAALALAAAVVPAGCARPPDNAGVIGHDRAAIAGHYTMHVTARDNPAWRGMVGEWNFEFTNDGRLFARQAGGKQMAIDMVYRFVGDILTINDLAGNGSCRHFGVDYASAAYRVRFVDSGFEARPLRDECTPRIYGMTLHDFERVR